MEPHYGKVPLENISILINLILECGLCETQGMSNCMFQHLVGRDHRQKFVEHLFPNDPNMLSLSQVCCSQTFKHIIFLFLFSQNY